MTRDSIQDKILPVMVVALIGAAFALGMMWGKVQVYEKGGAAVNVGETDTALVPEEAIELDEESQEELLVNPAYAKGDENAPVALVEFTDYECPFCKRYVDETLDTIMSDYVDTGKVKYIVRDLPLGFHSNAVLAAMTARCAGDQEKFWEMHGLIFDGQGEWSLGEANEIFKGYAGELGLDTNTFNECLDSEKYADVVEADSQLAAKYGASGTPSFFVNGKILVGAQPIEAFIEVIEEVLGN